MQERASFRHKEMKTPAHLKLNALEEERQQQQVPGPLATITSQRLSNGFYKNIYWIKLWLVVKVMSQEKGIPNVQIKKSKKIKKKRAEGGMAKKFVDYYWHKYHC